MPLIKQKTQSYIFIETWMIKDLNLSGNELLCYAILYNYRELNSVSNISIKTIMGMLNCKISEAHDILLSLDDKEEIAINIDVFNKDKEIYYTINL